MTKKYIRRLNVMLVWAFETLVGALLWAFVAWMFSLSMIMFAAVFAGTRLAVTVTRYMFSIDYSPVRESVTSYFSGLNEQYIDLEEVQTVPVEVKDEDRVPA